MPTSPPAPTLPLSPASGPIAVTGASGFIGSWVVADCLRQGYTVRACVRNRTAKKVAHLLALKTDPDFSRGTLELFEADLLKFGSYDAAFRGACGVVHVAAAVGFNRETPQEVYDGCFSQVKHVVRSVKRSGSVRRFVFTSSCAAVLHPQARSDGPPAWQRGYVFTERDWCDQDNADMSPENIPKNRDVAYSLAKAETERYIYAEAGASASWDAYSILPMHVIGPVMAKNHDQTMSWQWCIRKMMEGLTHPMGPGGRMFWNLVDVRDTARAHRLCLESPRITNGSRYILAAADRTSEMFTWQLSAMLRRFFPHLQAIGGEECDAATGLPVEETGDFLRAYCLLARQELGLKTMSVEETVRATGDSYLRLGLVKTKKKSAGGGGGTRAAAAKL